MKLQVHVPGAATELTTSWNGPWRVVRKRQKEFEIVHIVSGKRAWQHVTNLTSAPDPAHPEDHDGQYSAAVQRVDPVNRVPTEYELLEDVLLVVNEVISRIVFFLVDFDRSEMLQLLEVSV